MTSVLTLAACPVCGATDREPFALGSAPLLRCADCGTVHAGTYADPGEVFVDGYYTGGAGSFGIDVTHPRFQAFLARVAHRRLGTIERWAGRVGRLLDVGCGSGEVLAVARQRGWEVVGVEPTESSAAIARGRGLDVRTAMLADSGVEPGIWDVVCAFHVAEHVPDVPAFLGELARWTRPGGLVAAEVPNWDGALRRRAGEWWIHLRPLEHLTHFTPATLAGALRRAGLDDVHTETPVFLDPGHTTAEALESVAHPHWARWAVPVDRVGALRPGLRALARRQERRGRGMVVLAAGRRAA